MQVLSNVPASPVELSTNSPFRFEVKGFTFEVDPLTLRDYLTAEKKIHASLVALHYYDVLDKKDLSKQIVGINAISKDKALSIIDILIELMEPLQPKEQIKILGQQFKKYWFKPSRWAFSLKSWFIKNLAIDQILDLASYFMRYSSETKKKIHLSLQNGIESATKEMTTISQPSIAEPSILDSLSPLGIQGIAEAHGSLSA